MKHKAPRRDRVAVGKTTENKTDRRLAMKKVLLLVVSFLVVSVLSLGVVSIGCGGGDNGNGNGYIPPTNGNGNGGEINPLAVSCIAELLGKDASDVEAAMIQANDAVGFLRKTEVVNSHQEGNEIEWFAVFAPALGLDPDTVRVQVLAGCAEELNY